MKRKKPYKYIYLCECLRDCERMSVNGICRFRAKCNYQLRIDRNEWRRAQRNPKMCVEL